MTDKAIWRMMFEENRTAAAVNNAEKSTSNAAEDMANLDKLAPHPPPEQPPPLSPVYSTPPNSPVKKQEADSSTEDAKDKDGGEGIADAVEGMDKVAMHAKAKSDEAEDNAGDENASPVGAEDNATGEKASPVGAEDNAGDEKASPSGDAAGSKDEADGKTSKQVKKKSSEGAVSVVRGVIQLPDNFKSSSGTMLNIQLLVGRAPGAEFNGKLCFKKH